MSYGKPGKICAARVDPIAYPGPNELAHVAPIAHLGQICAYELSYNSSSFENMCRWTIVYINSSLENICAGEITPIAQAGGSCWAI